MPISLTQAHRAVVYGADLNVIRDLLRTHQVAFDKSFDAESRLRIFFQRALISGQIPLAVLDNLPSASAAQTAARLEDLGYSAAQIDALRDMPINPRLIIAGPVMSIKRSVFFNFVAETGRMPRIGDGEAEALATLPG